MHKLLSRPFFIAFALTLTVLPAAQSQAKPHSVANVKANPDQVIEQIEFRDVTVGDALRILSEQSSLNIIASKAAAELHVTMFLRRVTAMEVIEAIAKTYNLWYKQAEDSNIIRLYTIKEYRLEDVEFNKEETEVFTLKNAKNALDLADTIQNLFSRRVFLSYGQNQQQLLLEMQQRFQRFKIVDSQSQQHYSATTAAAQAGGGSGSGGASGGGGMPGGMGGGMQGGQMGGGMQNGMMGGGMQNGMMGGGMQGGQMQYNPNSQALDVYGNLIGGLNNPQQGQVGNQQGNQGGNLAGQLTGEVDASRNVVENKINQQAPIFVGVIKHQNRVLVRTRDIDALNEIRAIKTRLDVESSMLLMEVKILEINLSDGFNSLFDVQYGRGSSVVATNTSSSTIASTATQALAVGAASFNPALLAFVVGRDIELRMQLAENEGRVTQLATPILLTSNQEVSRFFVGQQIPFVTGYTAGSVTQSSSVGGSAVTIPPIPTYVENNIGTTLLLTPNINADNTVNLQVLVEESVTVPNGATILVPNSAGAPVSETINTVSQKTFSGSVIAKDNTTVAVGGLIQESANDSRNQIPFLGDIPVLGFFFRAIADTRSRTELVVLIKPHIITSMSEAQKITEKMIKENSIHPNANKNGTMDVYTNPDQVHKGYKLEQQFKEYNNQDSMDRYKWDNPNPLR